MSRFGLACIILVALTGCAGVGTGDPLVIAPSAQDWDAAFSRLRPEEQSVIRTGAPKIDVSAMVLDGNIYHYGYGPPNGHPSQYDKLDISGICNGYNEHIAIRSASEWMLVSALTFGGYGDTEGGTQIHSFELRWSIAKSGQTIPLLATAEGPGVKIIWGASPEAIAAEANQAFALTFLRLVLQLEHADENDARESGAGR